MDPTLQFRIPIQRIIVLVSQRWKPVGLPAGRVTGRVEILRPAGQAGWNTGQILLSCY